jgi:hypothetical protein
MSSFFCNAEDYQEPPESSVAAAGTKTALEGDCANPFFIRKSPIHVPPNKGWNRGDVPDFFSPGEWNHSRSKKLHERFPARTMAMPPFADCLSSVVLGTVEAELSLVRARGKHSLVNEPTAPAEAWGCCAEYLSGTSSWEQWNIQERIRETHAFKALKVSDFRTKAAREMRDAGYAKPGIAFLHQAVRYRGKARYRDAIYLAYGSSVPTQLAGFVDDTLAVLKAFAAMAGGFCSMRVGKAAWSDFTHDLDRKRAISVSPKDVW